MASYHCSIKEPLSRGKGQSLMAKSAYNARTKFRDERTGETTKDYEYKGGLLASFVTFDPKCKAPEWFKTDPERMLNAAAAAEKRKDAREGQEIVFGFIHELGSEKNRFMLNDFLREQFTRREVGRVAFVNIHAPSETGDQRNEHAHVLLLLREAGPEGFGNRLPALEPEDYERIRQKWAEKGAKELRKEGTAIRAAGDEDRADALELEADRYAEGWRTLEQQRQAALERGDLAHAETLNREATRHRGPAVDAIERAGQETERGNAYRDTLEDNKTTAELKIELAEIQKAIADYERDWIEAVERAGIEKEKIERRLVPDPTAPAGPARQEQAAHPTPEGLRGTPADIRQAVQSSDSATALAAALADKGIVLAMTTKEEAERSRSDAAAAKEQGQYAPIYREGEIVAVDQYAHAYRLTQEKTGIDRRDMQRYLRTLDTSQMQGIEATQDVMHSRLELEQGAEFAERAPQRGGMRQQQEFMNDYNDRAQDHMEALFRERDHEERRRTDQEQRRETAEQDRQSDYLDQQRQERELFEPPQPESKEERRQPPTIKSPRTPSTERGRE
jgi:hypothetical protein